MVISLNNERIVHHSADKCCHCSRLALQSVKFCDHHIASLIQGLIECISTTCITKEGLVSHSQTAFFVFVWGRPKTKTKKSGLAMYARLKKVFVE